MNYLIDTSVIIEYGVEQLNLLLEDSLDKLFISDIILQEMDGHKNSDEAKGFNAREFFRTLANAKHSKVSLNDIKLKDGDYLSRYYLENGLELHVIVRNKYNARDINDSKIIEIAKDYDLNLVTRDIAQSVRATSIGVGVKVLSGDGKKPKIKSKSFDIKHLFNPELGIEKSLGVNKSLGEKAINAWFKMNLIGVVLFLMVFIFVIYSINSTDKRIESNGNALAIGNGIIEELSRQSFERVQNFKPENTKNSKSHEEFLKKFREKQANEESPKKVSKKSKNIESSPIASGSFVTKVQTLK